MNNVDVLTFDKESLITCFEDLSNEILYEIIEYLNICDSYESFYYLNNRFKNFFIQLSLPYKINIDLISKKTFDKYDDDIIIPYKNRIISFDFSNLIYLDKFYFDQSFIRLESLIINEIKSEKLIRLLNNLILIPRLYSLTIKTIGRIKNPNEIHQLIFQFPVLKYLNTKFQWSRQDFILSNSFENLSSIEYFISKSIYHVEDLHILLSYMPKLIHFSSYGYSSTYNWNKWKPITLDNLKYFHLDYSISFSKFQIFISNIYNKIEILRITTRYNNDYLDSNRWKQLILNYLPCLHTFDLEYLGKFDDNNVFYQLINGFISSFWIERQWFFDHQIYQYENINWIIFYSIKQKYLSEKIPKKYFRHIFIDNNNNSIDLYSSELILSNINLPIYQFYPFISLKKLYKLILICNYLNMNQLIEFLSYYSNIQILIFSTNSFSYLENQIYNNTIQKMIIRQHLTLKDVQQLFKIFQNLKYFEIKIKENQLELIIRFIFKYIHNNKYSSLHLLAFQDAHFIMINRFKKVIDREQLLSNYSIQYISDTAYLSW